MSLLCVSPRCRPPGHHATDCVDDQCPGCLPARAADGLRLCLHCTARIGTDAVELARLWYEIGHILSAGGSNGTPVRNPHPGLVLNVRGAEMRAEIRHMLASWCKLIAEERGAALPRDESQHTLGAYVAKHAQWLAAREFAGEAADELASLRGRAFATAYPEGVGTIYVGSCPEPDEEGERCPGELTALMRQADSLLPSKIVCNADSLHEWPTERWRALGRTLGRMWDVTVAPSAVASEYHLAIDEVYRLAYRCRWTTIREGRRVRYTTAEVVATLGMVA